MDDAEAVGFISQLADPNGASSARIITVSGAGVDVPDGREALLALTDSSGVEARSISVAAASSQQ